MHTQIVKNVTTIYNLYMGTTRGCDGNEKCSVENVEVECGEHREPPRKRYVISVIKQNSKVPIIVKFDVQVPLPSNAPLVDLKKTTQQLSSDILSALNNKVLNLNFNGIDLEYDTSTQPVIRFVRVACDEGQVPGGTKCGKALG